MRQPAYSGQFKKDVKLAEKRGKDLQKIQLVMDLLIQEAPLPKRLLDHALSGEWKSFRDLHIEPGWVLIYRFDGDFVRFERFGTHADLFVF